MIGKRNLLYLVLCCALIVLISCENEATEDGGESVGVYYAPIDSKVVSNPYNYGMLLYETLHYDNRVYISVDSYGAYEKEEINFEEVAGEEISTVYSNHNVYWSADKDELAEVTIEGGIYGVKGYDDEFRVCVYYEVDMSAMGEDATYYSMTIFDCLNGIYLDKGCDLFEEKIDLSRAVKAECSGISIDMEDEKLQMFLEALYDGKFIGKDDESYPELKNVCCNEISFLDEHGMKNAITVYENGYVTKSTNGHATMIIKVDESACRQMVWSWSGIYRADKIVDIGESESVNHYFKVEIRKETENHDVMNHISVYMKKVIRAIDGEGTKKEEVVLNNEVEIPFEVCNKIVFSMKESGFLDNAEDLKDVYLELVRERGDKIYIRYSYSEEGLENEEYYILKRSEY